MNPFFDEQGKHWVEAARRRGARIDAPTLDSRVALELLELARVAAHTQERRFAPLSCYLAGVAAERLRAAQPETDDANIAAFIEEVRKQLESEGTPPS
jgi:D-serine deaminase-like pyridoxal phosphate-dependent protein